jgi:hypothetical protein
VKRSICVELLEEHPTATFYAVRFAEERGTEFDRFFDKFSTMPLYNTDMHTLAYWMEKIGKEGILERFFRPEGGRNLKALPIDFSLLRLYCYNIDNSILLFAGGGHKKTRTYQEDPILDAQVQLIRVTGNKILRYIQSGKIVVVDNKLQGKLCFDIQL